MSEITHEELLERIYYDPLTGVAVRKITVGSGQKGTRYGFIVHSGKRTTPYRYAWLRGKHRPLSHIAHFYMTGRWPVEEMDHINGESLDDRWENLRECTRAQNEANRGPRRNNKTGMRGVILRGSRFAAAFHRKGRRIHLGTFPTAQDASRAYINAVKSYDGEFLRIA